jgi:hypothetical protein
MTTRLDPRRALRQRLEEDELINRMNRLERAVMGESEWTPDVIDDEAEDDVDF